MNTEEEKNSGYKFAAAFLVTTGSILYVIYNYNQNNPISGHWYIVTCGIIAGTFYSILGFMLYIFIDGYLVVVRNHIQTEYLNKIGTFFYKYSLLFFVSFIPGSVLVILIDTYTILQTILYFMSIIGITILFLSIKLKKDEHKKSKTPTDQSRPFIKLPPKLYYKDILPNGEELMGGAKMSVAIFLFLVLFVFTIYIIASWSPFQGHVAIDMESIHYKNDAQIPVLIQVTGPNTGVLAILYNDLSGNLSTRSSIGPIDPIFIEFENGLEKRNIESNNIFVGNYLGNGKYSVFISTADLTTGYYELTCLRKGYYENTCESKSFYLLNKSLQSHIR